MNYTQFPAQKFKKKVTNIRILQSAMEEYSKPISTENKNASNVPPELGIKQQVPNPINFSRHIHMHTT